MRLMAPSPEVVLWTTLRKIDWHATLQEQQILPRYTQFGRVKEYVGLRETVQEAWSSRVLSREPDANPADFLMVKVVLSPLGFVHYATEIYRPGTPRFHKAIFNDGQEWATWRFYGGIPLCAAAPGTGESLVRVEPVADWDYTVVASS